MSAELAERTEQPEAGGHDVIHLGGEEAVVVPMNEYRLLAELRKRATPEALEEAEADIHIAEHEEWKAAGRPGEKDHDEFMAEIFGRAR